MTPSMRLMRRLLPRPVIGGLLALVGVLAIVGTVVGQVVPVTPGVDLSSEPLYARGFRAKPTLTLALSVEFPTVGAAYVNGADQSNDPNYTLATTYVGYFDANGCYSYDDSNNHFVRNASTTTHACDGSKFSGNFMNWATTSAIDILRYGLTGGDRIEDTTSKTVLQRAVLPAGFYNSSNFPSKRLSSTLITGALPSTLRGSHTGDVYIANCQNKIFFGTAKGGDCSTPGTNGNLGLPTTTLPTTTDSVNGPLPSTFQSTSCASENGSCTITDARYVAYGANNKYFVKAFPAGSVGCNNSVFGDPIYGTGKFCYISKTAIAQTGGLTTDGFFYSRVQVCDTSDAASRTSLCTLQLSGSYKPTGNLQRYSDRMRVAVFGYLKDDTLNRYGGVLRAPMKYVGPKYFDDNFTLMTGANPKREWDETTGVFTSNPESATDFSVSGAVNYLNQFGRTGVFGEYKYYDPVSELYYEALRYLQGLDPSSQATSGMTIAQKDGFPVYSTWTDPHPVVTGLSTTGTDTYACIKNNILTIGDVNTHADKSLPGNTLTSNFDFSRAANASANEPDFVQWTKVVGAFESGGAVSYADGKGVTRTTSNPSTVNSGNANLDTKTPPCCSDNRYYMAGAAYWANTHDIRANGLSAYASSKARPGMRVTTYMIDVNEYGQQTAESAFKQNQFYLSAKYGGFSDRSKTGNPFLAENGTSLDNSNWARSVVTSVATDGLVAKSYFQGNNATELLASLDEIFATVVREAGSIAGAAVSSSRLTTDLAIYQGSFDPSDWSGDLGRYVISRNSSGGVFIGASDDITTKFASKQLDALTNLSNRKIFVGKTLPGVSGVATEFKWDSLDSDHKLTLKTPPTLLPLDSDTTGQGRVDYIRGDRSQESTGVFRRRGSRLGDIINSGALFSGKPTTIVGDSSYSSFLTNNQSRPDSVFVGANDGMLHAFNADTMAELFAYIPSFVVKNLRDFTLPSYAHRSFVDATSTVKEAKVGSSWKTVLVSGAGAGGQGVFALDVSNPASFSASNVMWEFTDRNDASMGNVIGRPQILRLRHDVTGTATLSSYKYYAVVASGVNNNAVDGYASSTGKPAIFILDLDKSPTSAWVLGSNYFKIELPAGNTSKANGIVGFSAVPGAAGEVKLLYAGDLQGNLWKLNFSGKGKSNWDAAGLSAFKSGSTPQPLFVASDASDVGQPITVEPKVINGPNRSTIVAFGTGRFLEVNDLSSVQTQSFYTVYDNGKDKVPNRTYLKQATSTTSGVISTGSFTWGVPASADATGVRGGWYFNFPGSSTGERQVSGITVVGGYAVFGTVEPAVNGCADGSGRVYVANLATGVGNYSASTVGIQGEPLLMRVGADSYTTTTSAGRSTRTTTWQIVLQGSAGIRLPDGLASGGSVSETGTLTSTGKFLGDDNVQERNWRQIFNYDELRTKPWIPTTTTP